MLDAHKIYLYDRIKETSYTTGTSDFLLNGAANGFSSFGSVYQDGDNLFYAITDGTSYEVGSGVYRVSQSQNYITRYPFRSSNSNNIVNFGVGLKEVFATYPATHSVYTASGLQNHSAPKESGIAFWSSSNIINYDSNLIWDSGKIRMGINKPSPSFAIDIGGNSIDSIIRASGFYTDGSGVIFPSGNNGSASYHGGIQLTHYEQNSLVTLTGLDSVIELSGNAQNYFLLKPQNAGLVFAGPASGCTPPCSPDYPTFRPLLIEDIHDINTASQIDNSMLVYNSAETEWEANAKITFDDNKLLLNCVGNNSFPTQGFQIVSNSGVGNFRSNSFYNGEDPVRLIFRRGAGDINNPTMVNAGGGLFAIRSETYDSNGDVCVMGGLRMEIDNDSTVVPGAKIFMRTTSGGADTESSIRRQLTLYSTGLLENTGDIKASGTDFSSLKIREPYTPSSPTDTGDTGQITWDDQFLYVCVAPNTWKRVYLTSWTI